MYKSITPGAEGAQNAVVALANWYQFGRREQMASPHVESRMLLWCRAGKGMVHVNGEQRRLVPDDFLVLPWGHQISYEADPQRPFLVGGIHVIPQHTTRHPAEWTVAHGPHDNLAGAPWRRDVELDGLEGTYQGHFHEGDRVELLASYVLELARDGPPAEEIRRLLARLLIAEWQLAARNRWMSDERRPAIVVDAQQFIRARLDQHLTVQEIASHVGCSPATLGRVFRRHTGAGPKNWITDEKMRTAKHLLRTTNWTVKEVAEKLAFFDPYHFSRQFKRHVGVPPSIYLSRVRKI